MAQLEVQNISKRFGKLQALADVSFDVQDGEFVVMLGPTAAGKTTTLRCIAGLEKLNDGRVMMDGAGIDKLSPAERDIAFVFQTYALYPRKTAFENMAFPLQAREMSPDAIKTRVHDIAALLQISELLNRRPAAMSGGQQQRVALGRAMVRQPRIFLMDEPLTNLDFKLRVEMRAELKRLQRELATTFFYVTNDQVEAMSMADRVIVLNEGVVQQIDTPERVYDYPANLFVAQFVGSPRMNTIPCQYDAGREALIMNTGVAIALQPEQSNILRAHPQHEKLLLGVRSEDIQIHPVESKDAHLIGEIFVVEPLGDRTYVDVLIGDTSVKARADAVFTAQTREIAYLTFDIDRIHVFDAGSEITIF